MHARYTVKDSFFRKAKKEGYRARSAYKLEEIARRFRIIKKGDRVLDLGSAPGSWLQVESALVGEKGLVVGVDILSVAPVAAPNVVVSTADIREIDVGELLRSYGFDAFDVVTSDVAPNLSGIREVDDARVGELCRAVLRIADEGLRQGGNLLVKLFYSPEFESLAADLRSRFSKVTTFKPKASRGVSAEVYLVCLSKR